MKRFLTIGEPLIVWDSTQKDRSVADSTNFNKSFGGAELNVAIGISRLGFKSFYATQIGSDLQGRFILKKMKEQGVRTDFVKEKAALLTGYQLKQLVSRGDPKVYNFRKNSAASAITPSFIDKIDLTNIDWIHLTGIFLALSKSTQLSCKYLVRKIVKNNIPFSFDPNIRKDLWKSKVNMINTINEIAENASYIFPGIEEGKILTGYSNPESIADFYLKNPRTQAVFVKVGSKGSYVKSKSGINTFLKGFKAVKIKDTVGAGDGFATGVITALMEKKSYVEAAHRGNAIGCMQVQTYGDNDGYPTRRELSNFYKIADKKEKDCQVMLRKYDILNQLKKARIVAVIRGKNEENSYRTAKACIDGGITAIELAFTSPHADKTIGRLSEEYGFDSNVVIGAGTVLDAETARIALIAGAKFIVSPSFNKKTAEICNLYSIPYIPGTFSSTEVQRALISGSDLIKVFPGSVATPSDLKELHGPFPNANLMPSGGVNFDNMSDWIDSGAFVLGIGGGLVSPGLDENYTQVEKNAEKFISEINKKTIIC